MCVLFGNNVLLLHAILSKNTTRGFTTYSFPNSNFVRSRLIGCICVAVMKLAVLCLFAVISVIYADTPNGYTNKFDNIDVDQILTNERLLKRYIDCILDKPKVRCPAEAVELKSEYSADDYYFNYKCSQNRKRF